MNVKIDNPNLSKFVLLNPFLAQSGKRNLKWFLLCIRKNYQHVQHKTYTSPAYTASNYL
jgi:hypothetical protein